MRELRDIVGMMALMAVMMLMGCSRDDDALQQPATGLSLVAVPLASDYVAVEDRAAPSRSANAPVTRSWTPPTGYYLYDLLYDGTYEGYESVTLTNRAINVFFTHLTHLVDGDGNPTTAPNQLHSRLTYVNAETPYWKLVLPNDVEEDEVASGNYYVYGFIPSNAADGAEIKEHPDAARGAWDEGAVLTIRGLKTVAADLCVIIGAQEGERVDGIEYDAAYDGSAYDRTERVTAGDFRFRLDTGNNENYLFLLFDHLGSALSISMQVNPVYDRIRTIKLKEIRMKTASDDGPTRAKMDVTVTLKSNTEGSNPIESIVYKPDEDSGESDGVVYQNREGLELSTDPKQFLGHFLPHPQGVTNIILTCTYDVYDKKNYLIREDCKATNTIPLKSIYGSYFEKMSRGHKYSISLTINPTYLYMMSEPDEEDISFEVN